MEIKQNLKEYLIKLREERNKIMDRNKFNTYSRWTQDDREQFKTFKNGIEVLKEII